MEAEVAAAKAKIDAEVAKAQAEADKARAEHSRFLEAELAKLRARGVADPEAAYRAAQAKGRELASQDWERFERDALPRREAARAKFSGADLEREMMIIDVEIDARLALRAAEIARGILDTRF